jgi:ParB-like chromosome segregation protein Spo0J
MADFKWTEPAELAAELVAEGELSLDAIAERVGVARSTLRRWRQHPQFNARVDEALAGFRAAIRSNGLAVRERRVKALNDRWKKLLQVVEERAVDPARQNVPGGKSGLLVHNVKGVGKGDDFRVIDLYEVDTGLLRELREIERQIAQELGQWTEKQVRNGETVIRIEYADGPLGLER